MDNPSSKIIYTKDQLKKLNVYALRQIPQTGPGVEKYKHLNKFVRAESRVNLSNIISRPVIPSYLKDKYGDSTYKPSSKPFISRGNYREKREQTRRKLVVKSSDTDADKVNNAVRNLLPKLSESNKDKLFEKFRNFEITDECSEQLVDNLYSFAIDCNYLVSIYVELMFVLKTMNQHCYDELIKKILDTAVEPIEFENDAEAGKTKRWWLANMVLIAEIHHQNNDEITLSQIAHVVNELRSQVSVENSDHLEVVCELLKLVMPDFLDNEDQYDDFIDEVVDQLESMVNDKSYDVRHRFLIEEVLDIYNYESDEED